MNRSPISANVHPAPRRTGNNKYFQQKKPQTEGSVLQEVRSLNPLQSPDWGFDFSLTPASRGTQTDYQIKRDTKNNPASFYSEYKNDSGNDSISMGNEKAQPLLQSPVEQISNSQKPVEQVSNDQTPGQTFSDQIPAAPATVDQTSVDQVPGNQTSAQTSSANTPAAQASAQTPDGQTSDKSTADQTSADQTSADQTSSLSSNAFDKDVSTTSKKSAANLIVDDSVIKVNAGQLRKTDFLQELRQGICNTIEPVLAGVGQTTDGCPYLNYWLDSFMEKDAAHLESTIKKYAPASSAAKTATEYISIVSQKALLSASRWAATGKLTAIPEGMPADLVSQIRLEQSIDRGIPKNAIMFKAKEDGARKVDDPSAIQNELGAGQPLSGQIRSSMEPAFGMDFSQVRVHTDTTAKGISNRVNARAFTVGNHIAFGSSEYQPDTPAGDALIAHELAHVAQQKDGKQSGADTGNGGSGYSALENDADVAAANVVTRLINRKEGTLFKHVFENTMPRLRSGLRLQRCSKFPSYSEIVADKDVKAKTDAAWSSTKAATTAASRREEGFWIRLNNATEKYEFTPTVVASATGPTATASIILGARPADTIQSIGNIYTVGSFHTHTPMTYRTGTRGVGPSAADGAADTSDDVAGVVYDYVESPVGSGTIPGGHPLNSPAQRYHSGPTRRQKE